MIFKSIDNQTSEKRVDTSFMSILETAELFSKDPNYDLITPNGIVRYFIVFIEVEELSRLVIPIGITRSERVNFVIRYKQLNWYGHVQRMDQERLPRRILKWCPPGKRRKASKFVDAEDYKINERKGN